MKWNMTAGFTCAAASAAEAGGGWTTSSACRVLRPPRQSQTTSIFKVQLRSVANNHHHLLKRIPDRETIHATSALSQAPPTGADNLLCDRQEALPKATLKPRPTVDPGHSLARRNSWLHDTDWMLGEGNHASWLRRLAHQEHRKNARAAPLTRLPTRGHQDALHLHQASSASQHS